MAVLSRDPVPLAEAWLGTAYRHRASLCGSGADCLGLIRGNLAQRALWGGIRKCRHPTAPVGRNSGAGEPLQIEALMRHLIPAQPSLMDKSAVSVWNPLARRQTSGVFNANSGRGFIHACPRCGGSSAPPLSAPWAARYSWRGSTFRPFLMNEGDHGGRYCVSRRLHPSAPALGGGAGTVGHGYRLAPLGLA